jgi:DNA polymerase-3 subunit epsilon
VFAVVDIETTGGRPESDKITEVAILLHDGEKVVRRFSSLVNPRVKIPPQITQLTGISNEMVRYAPQFHEIARDIIDITKDAVFVAHNARFDYGFIKAAYKDLGYTYQRQTLCTVRLSRVAFPGLPSYSLGNLCDSLDIELKDRHRALGDAEATAILLGRIFEQQKDAEPQKWIKAESKKTAIPPLLKEETFEAIPDKVTGVYYFHNQSGHILYIGKAIDIRKRMVQHFALSGKGSQRSLQLKNEIADIRFVPTGSELLALLLEADEIKKHKPLYNVALKRVSQIPYYGIYTSYDAYGYIEFSMRRLKDGDQPFTTANNMHEARNFLNMLVERYQLCQSKCNLHSVAGPCFDYQLHKCQGACVAKEDCDTYNKRALKAIRKHGFQDESFLIVGKGRQPQEQSIVCVEQGKYKGFGFIDISSGAPEIEAMRAAIQPYAHNRDIQQILCTYLRKDHTKILYHVSEETGAREKAGNS